MRTKDTTVQCIFHPAITAFLFGIDSLYRDWDSELVITSGSEPEARHKRTSLHYATPCQAADIRIWETGITPPPAMQQAVLLEAAKIYCDNLSIPHDWIDIVLESDHIHIEYQPKRTF